MKGHTMLENILEKLAEMFPRQHYQSCLERYLAQKQIKSAADAEYWAREYERNHKGNLQ
jgi:hypothetical protein